MLVSRLKCEINHGLVYSLPEVLRRSKLPVKVLPKLKSGRPWQLRER